MVHHLRHQHTVAKVARNVALGAGQGHLVHPGVDLFGRAQAWRSGVRVGARGAGARGGGRRARRGKKKWQRSQIATAHQRGPAERWSWRQHGVPTSHHVPPTSTPAVTELGETQDTLWRGLTRVVSPCLRENDLIPHVYPIPAAVTIAVERSLRQLPPSSVVLRQLRGGRPWGRVFTLPCGLLWPL